MRCKRCGGKIVETAGSRPTRRCERCGAEPPDDSFAFETLSRLQQFALDANGEPLLEEKPKDG